LILKKEREILTINKDTLPCNHFSRKGKERKGRKGKEKKR
jgi:hypothetical protein